MMAVTPLCNLITNLILDPFPARFSASRPQSKIQSFFVIHSIQCQGE